MASYISAVIADALAPLRSTSSLREGASWESYPEQSTILQEHRAQATGHEMPSNVPRPMHVAHEVMQSAQTEHPAASAVENGNAPPTRPESKREPSSHADRPATEASPTMVKRQTHAPPETGSKGAVSGTEMSPNGISRGSSLPQAHSVTVPRNASPHEDEERRTSPESQVTAMTYPTNESLLPGSADILDQMKKPAETEIDSPQMRTNQTSLRDAQPVRPPEDRSSGKRHQSEQVPEQNHLAPTDKEGTLGVEHPTRTHPRASIVDSNETALLHSPASPGREFEVVEDDSVANHAPVPTKVIGVEPDHVAQMKAVAATPAEDEATHRYKAAMAEQETAREEVKASWRPHTSPDVTEAPIQQSELTQPSGTNADTSGEPSVYIGQIDVIIESSETKPAQDEPLAANRLSSFASAHFLRRL